MLRDAQLIPQAKAEPRSVPRTLARGFLLLELVASSPQGAGVTDVAARSGLDKGTVSRLLSALKELGYVSQRPTDRRYILSGKVLVLARSYENQLNLRDAARPHLAALRDATNETVHLAIREGRQLVYVDQAEPDREVRLASAVGQSLPLHVTAMGRAVLAAMPQKERNALMGQLVSDPHFAEFVVDLDHIRDEVEHARRDGWATVARDDEVTRVGVAVLDATGQPVGAISISGPAYRTEARVEELAALCRAAGRRISAALGG
ncbi:IclR family transcriptional regulator [Streptomyces sp. NPDC058576]|uniref:IclR family transcriptional regulator n=1 Tax=Streptomyces sp. NPDC058576 TaxID=3346547 RepID=UPI0036511139